MTKKMQVIFKGQFINIKSKNSDGNPYPDFLLQHITSEWGDVGILEIDPDICLKVDSSLSYCGCIQPSKQIRQYMYAFQKSEDFDHETVSLIIRIARQAQADSWVWSNLLAIEFERDCGSTREEYIQNLESLATRVESDISSCDDLLSA